MCLVLVTAASALAPASSSVARLLPQLSPSRTSTIALKQPTLYEEYLRSRGGANGAPPPAADMPPSPMYEPPPTPTPESPPPAEWPEIPSFASSIGSTVMGNFFEPPPQQPGEDTEDEYGRVPWWRQGSAYTEMQRQDRRTIFMHDDWVRHRSSQRFLRNIRTIGSSGINQALSTELTFVTLVAVFIVVSNMIFFSYTDFAGIKHPGPLNFLDANIKALSLPALPFTISLPALSLLLVFRTNTGYFRWNEARTLWGGLINNCRNVVRQTNTFFPDDPYHNALKLRMAAETNSFIKALRNFLRGPTDDDTLRGELYALVDQGLMTAEQADATMAASNRPMFCVSAMSSTLRKADIDPMHTARIDATISTLVDLTGANERIFKSPIPLVYTRLTARFLTIFLVMLPLALWGTLGESWNHWTTIPAEFLIAFFLFGIEEVGIQIEEPFSILPLEAFCNGAIAATTKEMLGAVEGGVFEEK